MNSFILESGVLPGTYFREIEDLGWTTMPVWKDDITLAKQFYSHDEAEQFVKDNNLTRVNIKRSRLTIKCRPGVIR